MQTTNTLARLAQYTDAQMKKHSPLREIVRRELADQCYDEGYPSTAIRIARIGGTAALDRYLVEDD